MRLPYVRNIENSKVANRKMYDKLLYDITLRTLQELYETDAIKAIDSIIFNDW
jgi:restriction system protein